MARDGEQPTPLVSVLMANFNGAAFIEDAVRSVFEQTLADLELIVVDDGSTDDSISRLVAIGRTEPRLRIFRRETSGGPGAARNAALDAARGRWLAVVDSDDLIHPERLAAMVAEAEQTGADILLDDLLIFAHKGDAKPATLFSGVYADKAQWVSLPDYIHSNRIFARETPLGFAKPLIRRAALNRAGLRYVEDLPVGEDYDLLARAMIHGLRMRTTPRVGYFYRKHNASISHRLDEARILAMAANAESFRRAYARPEIETVLQAREDSIADAFAFHHFIDALKRRDLRRALDLALERPRAIAPIRTTITDKLSALGRKLRPARPAPRRDLVLISRQRVIGPVNGSSAYLLSICRSLRQAGFNLTFLGPSPAAFGRWPVMRLGPEMAIFDEVLIRGGLRIGDFMIARDPRVLGKALLTGVELVLHKLRIMRKGWVRPAPYAISLPATKDDQLFVAAHARDAGAILCDYAFTTPLAPFALSPRALTAVVMHDLFSSRKAQFDAVGATDSVVSLALEDELQLLGLAECLLAVQKDEAATVASGLPGHSVLVTPMAVETAPGPAAGVEDTVLFVGSNTAPNVVGLRWLFQEVWPLVRQSRPDARLLVAGSVNRAIDWAPEGVELLGPVRDLGPLYESAAVVVSPLLTGSGLKIKVVEALARGKAVVATPVSLQGVQEELLGALDCAEAPGDFAACILRLLVNRRLREQMGAEALARARAHFSAEACYAPLIELVNARRAGSTPSPQGRTAAASWAPTA